MKRPSRRALIAWIVVAAIAAAGIVAAVVARQQEDGTDPPRWMPAKIAQLEGLPPGSPPRVIRQVTFRGKKAYYLTPTCCDIASELLDRSGVLICNPDGGFLGHDAKCPDFALPPGAPVVWQDARRPGAAIAPAVQKELAGALEGYRAAILRGDAQAAAAVFAPGAELSHASEAPIRGRDAIREFLASFAGYKVLACDLVATGATYGNGDIVQQGTYRQSVTPPQGSTLDVAGTFEAHWTRSPGGAWQVTRLHTAS